MARWIAPREQKLMLRKQSAERFEEAVDNGSYIHKADYGRTKVYACEQRAYAVIRGNTEIQKQTIEYLKDEANRIIKDKRVVAIDPYPNQPVYVENSCRRNAVAFPWARRMRFGGHKDYIALLHELAHILTPGDRHGDEFQRVECLLFKWFISEEAGAELEKQFWG